MHICVGFRGDGYGSGEIDNHYEYGLDTEYWGDGCGTKGHMSYSERFGLPYLVKSDGGPSEG